MEAQREEFVFQFRSLRCKAPRGWIGLRLRKTDSNRIRVASYSLASVWQTVKKGSCRGRKTGRRPHHHALTKRAHSSAQKFLGTSPNRSKSSESDDARSRGAQPFGIFINPLNHLGDFTMALDAGFSGCNKPKSLCKGELQSCLDKTACRTDNLHSSCNFSALLRTACRRVDLPAQLKGMNIARSPAVQPQSGSLVG